MSLIDFDTSALMLESRREIHEWLGGGVNGKGVKQKHQMALFGPDTMTSINIKELNNSRFGPVELFRKRILTCSETDRSTKDGKAYSTSLLKQITGGDPITADVKNKEHIDFIPFCKVAIVANDPPRFDDQSAGWDDRFRRNDFPYQFVEADEFDPNNPRHKIKDPHQINHIKTPEELSGYLNVMLYRAQTIIKDGTTPKCKHITEGYEEQVYSLEAFINRFCDIDPEKNASHGYYASPSDLFDMFDKWAELSNASRISNRSFSKIMIQRIGRPSHTFRVGGELTTGYEGIKFDIDKYFREIKKIEESLKGQAACASSAVAYADLKNKFASKSEPKFESVTESIASS
jgi:putative DNA primase/helicase